MSNEWIDGAVTPPKVGSVVRYRLKRSDFPNTYATDVLNPTLFEDCFYYTLEDSPRPFVQPEPPMPELLPDLDGEVPHSNPNAWGRWVVYSGKSQPDNPNYLLIAAPTERLARLRWNAAIEAVRGVKE